MLMLTYADLHFKKLFSAPPALGNGHLLIVQLFFSVDKMGVGLIETSIVYFYFKIHTWHILFA